MWVSLQLCRGRRRAPGASALAGRESLGGGDHSASATPGAPCLGGWEVVVVVLLVECIYESVEALVGFVFADDHEGVDDARDPD